MEEKKNIPTVEGEAITPEAPAADIPGTDAPSPDLTAGAPPQEQAGVTVSEPGDVVVSFDKIEELMAERRAAARDTVEQAEPAAPEVAAPVVEQAEPPTPEAPAPGQPEKAAEQAQEEKPQEEVAAEQKKPRRGRPPKAEKAEQAAPEADKEQTAAKPRRGRPPKADKAAPDEAQPPKPRDKVSRSKKAAPAKEESPTPEPVAVSGNTAPAAEIPAEPKEPAPPPRPVEEGKLVYLKLSELHPFHTFRPHPFKVTDDAKMQETVASMARPFPSERVAKVLAGKRVYGVVDRNVSFGWNTGIIYEEICASMNRAGAYVPNIPFIAGLGGEDITAEHINYAIDKIIAQDGKAEKHDTVWLNREVKRK